MELSIKRAGSKEEWIHKKIVRIGKKMCKLHGDPMTAFKKYDNQGDGFITLSQFCTIMDNEYKGKKMQRRQIIQIFNVIDIGNTRFITPQDWKSTFVDQKEEDDWKDVVLQSVLNIVFEGKNKVCLLIICSNLSLVAFLDILIQMAQVT